MIANFSQVLYKKLIQNGFNHIKGFYIETTLDENTRFIGLLKEEGASWHVLMIANMEVISLAEFIHVNSEYTNYFANLQERGGPRNIFITNIMLSERSSSALNSFINNLEDFVLEPVSNIYWNFNLEDGKVFLNKKRPTKVLNLRDLMDDAYSSAKATLGGYSVSKSMDEIRKIVYTEDKDKQAALTRPHLTFILLLINLSIFIFIEVNGGVSLYNLIRFGAIEPYYIINHGEYFRLFTAMFIHVGALHLMHNMLALYIFGTRIERYYNRLNFLIIYTFGGLVGSVFSLIFSRSVAAGASGAIFALIGAAAVMTKVSKQDLEGLNYHTMLIYIIVSVGVGLTLPNVDNFGHLGGLIGGAVIGYLLCNTKTA